MNPQQLIIFAVLSGVILTGLTVSLFNDKQETLSNFSNITDDVDANAVLNEDDDVKKCAFFDQDVTMYATYTRVTNKCDYDVQFVIKGYYYHYAVTNDTGCLSSNQSYNTNIYDSVMQDFTAVKCNQNN